ncbi:MAG: co-chaperone GroES [Candidatus Ratteibacteria bacterium]
MTSKFKIRPLADRVVVEPLEAEEKSKGGIILPDTAKEKPQEGKVVAVGKGRVNDKGEVIPIQVKVGDKVLYGKYAGTEVTVDDKQYIILREDDILAVIEEK